MKHKKTVQVPASERVVVDHVTCDLCGSRISRKPYDAEEVTVAHKTGEQYPYSAWGETVTVDLCGKCFTGRLLPWLESQGATPQVEEWEY